MKNRNLPQIFLDRDSTVVTLLALFGRKNSEALMNYIKAQDFATSENLRNTVGHLSSRLDSLSDNITGLKEDMDARFADMRKDMDNGFAQMRKDNQTSSEKTNLQIEAMRSSLLKEIYKVILIAIPLVSVLIPVVQKFLGVH